MSGRAGFSMLMIDLPVFQHRDCHKDISRLWWFVIIQPPGKELTGVVL